MTKPAAEQTHDEWQALHDFVPSWLQEDVAELLTEGLDPAKAFDAALRVFGDAYSALDYHAWKWHQAGASWAKIGEKMHISRQAAWERFNGTAAWLRRGDGRRCVDTRQPHLPGV